MKRKTLIIAGGTLAVTLIGALAFRAFKKAKNVREGNELPSGEKGLAALTSSSIVGKPVSYGSEGYVNVRTSPNVDDNSIWSFDFDNNLLGKVETNPVGKIRKQIKGDDGYFWYEIDLSKPIDGKTTGFVREDAVIIK